MTAIPVITFLHDLFSVTKGPYHRLVGRYTQRYCSRAVQRSTHELQKKVLFIAIAGADHVVARLLGVQGKGRAQLFSQSAISKKVTKQQVNLALRGYASAILVLLGSNKALLLEKTGVNETKWMQLWCWVFEYGPPDMQLFNEVLLPAYQQGGFAGLAAATDKVISDTLSVAGNGDGEQALNLTTVQDALTTDLSAISRALNF